MKIKLLKSQYFGESFVIFSVSYILASPILHSVTLVLSILMGKNCILGQEH